MFSSSDVTLLSCNHLQPIFIGGAGRGEGRALTGEAWPPGHPLELPLFDWNRQKSVGVFVRALHNAQNTRCYVEPTKTNDVYNLPVQHSWQSTGLVLQVEHSGISTLMYFSHLHGGLSAFTATIQHSPLTFTSCSNTEVTEYRKPSYGRQPGL